MSKLKQQWLNLSERVDAMSLRERALIFLAVVLVLLTLVNALLIDPQLTRQTALSKQTAATQAQTRALQNQIALLATQQKIDPDAALQARLQQLQDEISGADSTLRSFQSGLVSPQQMPALLKDIMQRNRNLRLVSLKTLPKQDLAAAVEEATALTAASPAEDQAAPELAAQQAPVQATPPPAPPQPESKSAVFRHGVEITVEGSYPDLLHYLAQMESSPWQMFWGKAELKTGAYPKATLTLTLYTLSLDKAWLTI